MALLRRELGAALRHRRTVQRRSLRDVAADAGVSLGYLSEVERGVKEASSELLTAICRSLGAPLPEILVEVAGRLTAAGPVAAPVATMPALPVPVLAPVADGTTPTGTTRAAA